MREIQSGRITTATMALFALPQIPQGFALLPVINYVPGFYSDQLGLPLAMVGLMLVLSRITDIITDPIIGTWSDRSTSRFGRRKPFIVAGIPMMMISAWFVFVPPEGVGTAYLFWGLFFLYLGFTFVTIPYSSWGAELSSDYDERSRLTAIRGAFGSFGSLLTLSIPVILQAMGYPDLAVAMLVMAVLFIILQPLFFAFTISNIPDRAGLIVETPALNSREKLGVILKNSVFMRLLAAILLMIIGMAVGATLNMIIFTHIAKQPSYFAPSVFVQNVFAIAAIPIWLKIAARMGKHRAMALAMLLIGACSAATFLVGEGDGLLLAACLVGVGVGMGAVLFLISAMIADLVDRDVLETGEERTGTYMAAASMATKIAAVFGVLVGTAVPGIAGFQPSDAVHSENALLVLRLVYSFTGVPLILIGSYLLWHYPLTREIQAMLRQRIDDLRAKSAAS